MPYTKRLLHDMGIRHTLLPILSLTIGTTVAAAQIGTLEDITKISDTAGLLGFPIQPNDVFGNSCAGIGDHNGDGVPDVVVGSRWADFGGANRGAVYVMFLDEMGNSVFENRIASNLGGFGGVLSNFDRFGESVASVGDLNGDGNGDIAVGAMQDDDGGADRGAVWILFLDSQANVLDEAKISDTAGGFTGTLNNFDNFGSSLANLGDLDGDGRIELAVGAAGADDGGFNRGAVWILSINSDGSVQSDTKISATSGGFDGELNDSDTFGWSLSAPGDLDSDGVSDIVVGTPSSDFPVFGVGSVWTLLLNSDGTVKASTEIGLDMGGFGGSLSINDAFGAGIANLGDLDGDGVPDIAVGASGDDFIGSDRGAVWITYLLPNGSVKSQRRVGAGSFGFTASLDNGDLFGFSVANVGDVNGDGFPDLCVGAPLDDDGGFSQGSNNGAAWIVYLEGAPTGSLSLYGCGVNPDDSMTVESGRPAIGTTFSLGLDDPGGTFPTQSLPFVFLGLSADAAFPCGTSLPGYGLVPGEAGELLLDLAAPTPVGPVLTGAPWTTPGTPTAVSIAVPNEPNLIGIELYAQGVLFDPVTEAIGLTNAAMLLLGI